MLKEINDRFEAGILELEKRLGALGYVDDNTYVDVYHTGRKELIQLRWAGSKFYFSGERLYPIDLIAAPHDWRIAALQRLSSPRSSLELLVEEIIARAERAADRLPSLCDELDGILSRRLAPKKEEKP